MIWNDIAIDMKHYESNQYGYCHTVIHHSLYCVNSIKNKLECFWSWPPLRKSTYFCKTSNCPWASCILKRSVENRNKTWAGHGCHCTINQMKLLRTLQFVSPHSLNESSAQHQTSGKQTLEIQPGENHFEMFVLPQERFLIKII